MRIYPPAVHVRDDVVETRARVDIAGHPAGFPDALWFRLPAAWALRLSTRIDPFVVGLSSVAAVLGEPIEIDASISERLHAGLEEYWSVFHAWHPERIARVAIYHAGFEPEVTPAAESGTAFSGGVDSFFTLFRHLAAHEPRPSHRVRYALFAHGFDIPLSDEHTFTTAFNAYHKALAAHGIGLVPVTTNIRQFVNVPRWEISHGSALVGTAMLLAPLMRRFFVPSSKSYTTLEPWGSDPVVDGLLSTDQFQVIHDGAAYSRFDKLRAMRDWDAIRPLVRTCWEHPDGLKNCGRCHNCRRTMYVLASLGVLEQFETFPPISTPNHFMRASWATPHERLFGRQAIAEADARRYRAIARAGRIAMAVSPIRTAWMQLQGRFPR